MADLDRILDAYGLTDRVIDSHAEALAERSAMEMESRGEARQACVTDGELEAEAVDMLAYADADETNRPRFRALRDRLALRMAYSIEAH